MAQNESEWPISLDSQLFQSFPTEVAQNNSEQPNLPDSQLFQSLPTKDDQFQGGGVNYQTQIVNTKLPNVNLQTYQLQMIDSGGWGVTTKCKL